MGASATLKKFAKSREKAYILSGFLNTSRARAIRRIRNVAEYFSQKSEQVQLIAVMQVENEILCLLPASDSRFSNLRNEMMSLINQSKQLRYERNRIPHDAQQ
jgi:hypothetical protein